MREIEKRPAAVIATQKRFEGKEFDWRKAATCIHLVRFHASKMGHKLPVVPRFRSALGAKKALKATGHDTLEALLDAHFERIPPAFMRVADILALPADDDWTALAIKGDKTKFLGWHESKPDCTIMDVDVSAAAGAWRL